jgi:hypothetical protein
MRTGMVCGTLIMTVVVGLVTPPPSWATVASYLQIKKFSSTTADGALTVTITTGGAIPTDGKKGAYGYAIMTAGFSRVLVLTTHLGIDDSKHVGVGGFHTHVLDLANASAACSGQTAEVDLGSAKKPNFDPGFAFVIKGTTATVQKIPVSALGGSALKGVAAFTLKPVMKGKDLTNLCVTVTSQAQ